MCSAQNAKVEGLILHKHGIFTFGEDAREAYERMIEMVTRAEVRLARNRKAVFASAQLPQRRAQLAEIAPILRGAVALRTIRKSKARGNGWSSTSASAMRSRISSTARMLARYAKAGVITPDHTIRTKNWPLLAPAPDGGKLDGFP